MEAEKKNEKNVTWTEEYYFLLLLTEELQTVSSEAKQREANGGSSYIRVRSSTSSFQRQN